MFGFGGAVGRCQSPGHMQPRGLSGCEAAPPRAGPRDEARPSWRKGSLPPPLHRQSGLGVAGGRHEQGGRLGVWIFVLDSASRDRAVGPRPRICPWGRSGGQNPPLPSLWRTLRKPGSARLVWGWGCGTGSRLAQLCQAVSPFRLSLILATTLDSRELQMTNFSRNFG